MQKGFIWDHIHIAWEEVIIRHAQSEIQVRQHMSVPLIDKVRMRRIFLSLSGLFIYGTTRRHMDECASRSISTQRIMKN